MSALAPQPPTLASLPRRLAADDLAEIVRSFTEAAERLQATHVVLDGQVRQLTAELAHANEQLRRSQELAALGEMAAGIAHEIRNPLGSIALDVEVLREDVGEADPKRTLCDRVLRAVRRLDQIVGDVLRFAKDLRLQLAPTPSAEILDAALESCEALVRTHGVTVERSDLQATLDLDRHLMTQALTNLVRNAVEAMASRDGERTLFLSTRRSRRALRDGRRSEHVVFRIEDTGGGIGEDLLERIFHPFFTTRDEGTGLGLAIVHRIVDAHGGAISACNTERGARFEIAVPVRPEDRSRRADPRATDSLDAAVSRRIATKTSAWRRDGVASDRPAAATID
jgi:signal transduction histidine kinase